MVESNIVFLEAEGADYIEQARQEQQQYMIDGLSQYILRCYNRAQEHKDKHQIGDQLASCLRAYEGKYTDAELAKFDGIDIFRNITNMLCNTALSWMEESYTYVDDKPWVLNPTPKPKLPERIKRALDEAINVRLQNLVQTGVIASMTTQDRQDVVRALTREAEKMAFAEAEAAVAGMSKEIEDQMDEANWRDEFAKFRMDLMIYKTAILKGPVMQVRKRASWDGDQIIEVDEPTLAVERVNPYDFFPSPDSTTCQNGEYVIERMRLTRSSLVAAKNLESFSARAVDLVLYDHKEGVDDKHESMSDAMEWLEVVDKDDPNLYVVYDFYGRVAGRDILAFLQLEGEGIDAERYGDTVITDVGEVDPYGTYSINAWLCGGKVIRLVLDPTPLDVRPYYSTSYVKVPGSFWGMCIPQMVDSLQREINAAARSRVFNMGIASGPMVEIDSSRMPEEDRPDAIEPWRIFYTDQSIGAGSQPAVRFYQANSNAMELTAVMEEAWQKGHDIAGLPPHMRGVNEGTARTLGAFAMQFNSAAKGIKRVMGNVDRDVIEPVIQAFYYHNMFYSDDDSIKADAQISARGVVGLVRKEQRESRPIETLQQAMPFLQTKPQAIDVLVNEFLTHRGYDPAELGTGPSVLESSINPSMPSNIGAPVGPQGPQIDGRSAPAPSSMSQTIVPPEN